MLDLLMGERIAQACRDAWLNDGINGRVSALVAIGSVALTVTRGAIKLIQSVI